MTVEEMFDRGEWLSNNYAKIPHDEWLRESKNLGVLAFSKLKTEPLSDKFISVLARVIIFWAPAEQLEAIELFWRESVRSKDLLLQRRLCSVIVAIEVRFEHEDLKNIFKIKKDEFKNSSYDQYMAHLIRNYGE